LQTILQSIFLGEALLVPAGSPSLCWLLVVTPPCQLPVVPLTPLAVEARECGTPSCLRAHLQSIFLGEEVLVPAGSHSWC
jgi:hypothetical protein